MESFLNIYFSIHLLMLAYAPRRLIYAADTLEYHNMMSTSQLLVYSTLGFGSIYRLNKLNSAFSSTAHNKHTILSAHDDMECQQCWRHHVYVDVSADDLGITRT